MEKVLVIGIRRGLIKALRKLKIPFSVWHAKKFIFKHPVDKFLSRPYPLSKNEIKAILQEFKAYGPYTHVIAGTESAVLAAAVARKTLNCRNASYTLAQRCHDKLFMKRFLMQHQIPMTPFLFYHQGLNPKTIWEQFNSPVVIKKRCESGGKGIIFETNFNLIKKKLTRRYIYEKYIDAPEASVESFINNKKIYFTSITQYYKKKHINLIPSHFPLNWQEKLLILNKKIIEVLGIKWGLTHIEFYLSRQGILFGEVALRPPGGYIMKLMSYAYQFNAWEAFVAMELNKPFSFPKQFAQWTAAYILHPGKGVVIEIKGEQQITMLRSFKHYKINIKPQDKINERNGVSDEIGHIVLAHQNKEQLLLDLKEVEKNFQIII